MFSGLAEASSRLFDLDPFYSLTLAKSPSLSRGSRVSGTEVEDSVEKRGKGLAPRKGSGRRSYLPCPRKIDKVCVSAQSHPCVVLPLGTKHDCL